MQEDYTYVLGYYSPIPWAQMPEWLQEKFNIQIEGKQIYVVDTDLRQEEGKKQKEIMQLQSFALKYATRQLLKRNDWEKIVYNEDVLQKKPKQEQSCFQLVFIGKRKEIQASRYQNFLVFRPHIRLLEVEWGKYKYAILEHSKEHYDKIRLLLRDKTSYPVDKFYEMLEEALQLPITNRASINAFDHVWGYFKRCATPSEKEAYKNNKNAYRNGTFTRMEWKQSLWELTLKYQEPYLKESYFFFEVLHKESICLK